MRSSKASRNGPHGTSTPGGEWAPSLQKTRIYEQILLDIILGDLQPMLALDEQALAKRYAAGVAGVRDALGRLALEGIVVRRPRVGTIVAPLDIGEIEQAFEVRYMLEGRTAALAARNADDQDLHTILHAFDGADAAIEAGDFRAMLAMDRTFHRAVAYATHNVTLARFVVSLQNIATRYWIWQMEKQSPDDQRRDVELHRELARAIAARDPSAAEQAAIELVGAPPSARV